MDEDAPVVREPSKTESFLAERRSAYVRTFLNPEGDKVLTDLAVFCRFGESTASIDPRTGQYDPLKSAFLEGRREVILRILQHLNLSQEQLMVLFAGIHKGKG